jgi:protein-export membrane protein SecD
VLQVSPWTRIVTLLVLVAGILIALPNALPQNVLNRFPSWLPSSSVSLGLDLQGGSYLLLEVELDQAQKDKEEATIGDIRSAFRKAHIGYTDLGTQGDVVTVKVTDAGRYDEAKTLVANLNPSVSSSVLSAGSKQYAMAEPGSGVITLTVTQDYKNQTKQQILDQSIEVVRRRIDAMGTKEPDIARQGEDRILVQVPGLQDPDQLKAILGKTAKMTFQLVDETADPSSRVPPIGDEVLPQMVANPKQVLPPVIVQRRVMVSGDRLTDAGSSFDSRTGQPVVTFRFDSVGAREFGNVTKDNVGHRFAIVLDKHHRQFHHPDRQQPCHSAQGGCIAGAVEDIGRAHGRRRIGRGFGQGGPVFRRRRPVHGRGLHDPALRPVRHLCRYRADLERGLAPGGAHSFRRHTDASRDRRHRPHHGHGGGCERADL